MKEETFDYSKVPHNFGLCATDTCPYTDTCLRRIAYTYAPSNNIFLYVLNPKAIESTAGKCKYYCSNKKVRYAKGFIHTAEAISVGQSGTFRYRLIGLWGIRRYYQKRKGETLLSPTEQQQVIAIARNLGLQRAEYFDAYVEEVAAVVASEVAVGIGIVECECVEFAVIVLLQIERTARQQREHGLSGLVFRHAERA